MNRLGEAVLAGGRKLPYVITDNPPRGGMKYTYFAPDKSYVVQFFNDPSKVDANMRRRIEAIISKYNPTIPKAGAVRSERTKNVRLILKSVSAGRPISLFHPNSGSFHRPIHPISFSGTALRITLTLKARTRKATGSHRETAASSTKASLAISVRCSRCRCF